MSSLGLYDPRIYGVDPDILWTQLIGKNAGDRVDRTFGTGVDRGIGRRQARYGRAHIDNAAATVCEILYCCLCGV